jgi:hypothetical protein
VAPVAVGFALDPTNLQRSAVEFRCWRREALDGGTEKRGTTRAVLLIDTCGPVHLRTARTRSTVSSGIGTHPETRRKAQLAGGGLPDGPAASVKTRTDIRVDRWFDDGVRPCDFAARSRKEEAI